MLHSYDAGTQTLILWMGATDANRLTPGRVKTRFLGFHCRIDMLNFQYNS